MDKQNSQTFLRILPWVLTLLLLAAFTILGLNSGPDANNFTKMLRKTQLLSAMKVELGEAVEAEKSAVMAITDQASEEFAEAARQATAAVEAQRKELDALVREGKQPQETEAMTQFDQCWAQFRELDQELLGLAVRNTNLKAAALASGDVQARVSQFEASLKPALREDCAAADCSREYRLAADALLRAHKILALQRRHIEAAADADMDRLEAEMKAHDAAILAALQALAGSAGADVKAAATQAQADYAGFGALQAELLKLSRENTNVRSFELSLGRKRQASATCFEALDKLEAAFQSSQQTGSR